MTGQAAAIRDQFRMFAEVYAPAKSPLYARLSQIVMDNEALLDLAAAARPGQPAPNMLYGAVHLTLLHEDKDHPLRDYYPSVGGVCAPDVPGLAEAFADFCLRHADRLRQIIRMRVTNTNEVRRSACLMPAFAEAARRFGHAPFHLVEIGPSAGFNLLWDRFAYRYAAEGEAPVTFGDTLSADALVLDCALRGEGRPSWPEVWPPPIASRLGIERDPVNLANEEDRRWQRALIWPEHHERAERLTRALAIAAAAPPPVRVGDAMELLPDVFAGLPPGEPVCVLHSFVLYQFTKVTRARLRDMLTEAAAARPLCRVAFEGKIGRPEAFLSLTSMTGGPSVTLAFCDSHGSWIEWRATDAAHSADDPP